MRRSRVRSQSTITYAGARTALGGVPLGFYTRWRRSATKWNDVAAELTWHFYAAGLMMFSGLAILSAHQPMLCAYFAVFALMQLIAGARAFIKQRSQFSTRHLLVAMAIVALVAILYRWFGMAMAVVAWVAGSVGVMAILFIDWRKRKSHSEPGNISVRDVVEE